MTTYNTGSDSANTGVRAFLTKIGEHYLGRSFNTRSGQGKRDWKRIIEDTFNSKCAYCGTEPDRITIEHLIMFNREGCGLHHPGNVVPCCKACNSSRKKNPDTGRYPSWQEHLEAICTDMNEFRNRKNKIKRHIREEGYPDLTEDEINALRAICHHLFSSTKAELEKALDLFKNIDQTLVRRRS